METVVVAVDVGGTSIKGGLVGPHGSVVHSARWPTLTAEGPVAVLETIVGACEALVRTARWLGLTPVACGVVVPAVIDEPAGVLIFSANLGLREVPLRDEVARRTGLPTTLGHDVRAGAVAEARLGAGRGTGRMLFVGLGTGIASAFVTDGRVDPGAHGGSGELGHIPVRTGPQALPCTCGGQGCLERYASAAAIARAYGDPAVDAAEVVRRARDGDERAARVWQEAIEALAAGLLVAIALYDPSLVVLGGGLAGAGALLVEPLEKELVKRRTFHQLPDLALAELGDQAGCHGAAQLALDTLDAR